jgi:transposase
MRMSPVDLHRMVLALHRAGVANDAIATNLGLHPATVANWLDRRGSSRQQARAQGGR